MKRILLGLVSVLCLATGQAQTGSTVEDAPEFMDRAGERCINVRSVRSTEVVDQRTILFHMRGGRIFANHLSWDCPTLAREKRFSYSLSTSRLCNVDVVTVIEGYGRSIRSGAPCGLGMFYPITEEEADILSGDIESRRNPPISESDPTDESETED